MKITSAETYPVDRFLFIKVQTDEGITGMGESCAWGHLEAAAMFRSLQAPRWANEF